MNTAIAEQRLHNQWITRSPRRTPSAVVEWLGAVQAQEYPAARWGLALRMPPGITDAAIRRAFDEGKILRTHVMRPTWHFVTPADIRWMLELTGARVQRAMATYTRSAGLDAASLTRAIAVFERALRDGQHLTRSELGARLNGIGVAAKGVALALTTMHAELEGVICSGPYRGNQLTYALLAERAADARRLSRDEALAELTRRYFASHGPATIRDFVWWSGLPTTDAKRGLEMISARPRAIDGFTYWTLGRAPARRPAARVHLLPIYDEYLVAYRDRHAVPHRWSGFRPKLGPVIFQHGIVIGGQIAGTWRTARTGDRCRVEVIPMRRLAAVERRAISEVVRRYESFLGQPVSLTFE